MDQMTKKIEALQTKFEGLKFTNEKHGASTYSEWTQNLRENHSLFSTPEFNSWLDRLPVANWWISQKILSFPELGQTESEHCQPFVTSMIKSLKMNQMHKALANEIGFYQNSSAINHAPPNVIMDAHKIVSFNKRKPDIVMYKVGQQGACSITMLGEVKGRTSNGDFPDEQIGHILDISKELMSDHQFLRQHLYCFLTDGYRFQFFKCHKRDGAIVFHSSGVYNGVLGWQKLFAFRALTPEDLGLEIDEVEGYSIINGLGTGRFSRVYEVKNSANNNQMRFVLKYYCGLFKEMGRHEESILKLLGTENINNVPKFQDFIEHVHSSALVVTPVGIPIILASQTYRITTEMVLDLLSVLQIAHALQIIHRDVKPENIFLNNSNPQHIILIDWGSAVRLDNLVDGECIYQGTPLYGEECIHGVNQKPTKNLDLCCLVKTVFTIKQQKYPRCDLDRDGIQNYWNGVALDFPKFQTLLDVASTEDYSGLENSLENYFRDMWF